MKRVVHNTSILRIADTNLISGSFFQNTKNFPDYENKVQTLIKFIAKKNHISQNHIFLIGESRGAVGALLHGLLGNYPTVALDPLLDHSIFFEEFKDACETTFSFDFIPHSLIDSYNQLIDATSLAPHQIKLISSDNITGSYPFLKKLHLEKINLLNLNFKMMFQRNAFYTHGTFAVENYNVLLRYLNEFLIDVDMTLEKNQLYLDFEKWSVSLPDTNRAFYFKILDDALKVVRNGYDSEDTEEKKLNFPLKTALIENQTYHLTFEVKRNEKNYLPDQLVLRTKNQQQLLNKTKIEQSKENDFVHYYFISNGNHSLITFLSKDYPKNWQIEIKSIKVENFA